MGTQQQFCLKWSNHHSNIINVFESLLASEALVDVTLACEGMTLKAHKMVLSACSPFFQSIFLENPCQHPVIILKDMRYTELKAIVDFMYRGEVNVSQDQLGTLLKTAETLKVKGLAEVTNQDSSPAFTQENQSESVIFGSNPLSMDSPTLSKRKRGRPRKRSLSGSNKSDDDPTTSRMKEASPDTEVVEKVDNVEEEKVIMPFIPPLHERIDKAQLPAVPPLVEEPASGEDDFELEPTKLMEQTLTTDVSIYSSNSSHSNKGNGTNKVTLPSSQTPVITLDGSRNEEDGQFQETSPQEQNEDLSVRPFVTYEEAIQQIHLAAEPSSAVSIFMDSSSVPAIAGPSTFPSENHPPQQEAQPESGGDGWRCRVCGIHFTSKCALTRHMQIHYPQRERYVCGICSKVISRKDHLRRHVRLRHMPRDQLHVCRLCQKPFVSITYLGRHMKSLHPTASPLLPPESSEDTPLALDTKHHQAAAL